MARNTPLSTLLRMLKAAVGDSLTIGTQADSLYQQRLSDKQQWLAGEYDFPFLKDRWDVPVTTNDRFKAFPTTTVDGTANVVIAFERPVNVFVNWTNNWQEVKYGIDELTEFNNLNSDNNQPGWARQPNDPVQRWEFNGESQFEIWPIPVTRQTIRFVGQRALSALVAPTDTADLDDQFLITSLAVDLLLKKKSADAQALLASAQQRFNALRACYPCRTRQIVLGGQLKDRMWRRRVPIVTVAGGSSSEDSGSGTVIGVG